MNKQKITGQLVLLSALTIVACGHSAPDTESPSGKTVTSDVAKENPSSSTTGKAPHSAQDKPGMLDFGHEEPPPFEVVIPPVAGDCWEPSDVTCMQWKDGKIRAIEFETYDCSDELYYAVDENNVPLIKTLLRGDKSAPPDINCRTGYGWTLLHSAAMGGHLEAARLLVKRGIKLSACDMNAMTPLHYAVKDGRLKTALLLIAKGANPNAVSMSGDKPFHLVWMGAYELDGKEKSAYSMKLARALIKAGANVNAPDGLGSTPLHHAADNDDLPVIKLLVKHGASVLAKDKKGKTPGDMAHDSSTRNYFKNLPSGLTP